jgi:hypothetical protein
MGYTAPPQNIVYFWYPEIRDFVGRVNRASFECPFWVTSWWRSEGDNDRVGGNKFSQHLIATGVDLVARAPYSNAHLNAALRRQGLITDTNYPKHVHAQLYPAGFLKNWLS